MSARSRRSFLTSSTLSVLLGALTISAGAEAAPRKGLRITWARGTGAERCVGALGLQEDVKSRLGYDAFALPSEVSVEGTVTRAPRGFRAEITVRDGEQRVMGTRQLESRETDCRSLGEAVAVAITVAIDPESTGQPRTSDDAQLLAAMAPQAPPVVAAPAPAPSPPLRGHATLGAGASVGLVPGLGPFASLRLAAHLGARWELGIGASFWSESREKGLAFTLATAAVEACVAPWVRARGLRWCAAGHVGVFGVYVFSPELAPLADVGMSPWVGVETGPALALPLGGPWRLEISAAAMVPITKRQAFFEGPRALAWEQSVVAGRTGLGFGADF